MEGNNRSNKRYIADYRAKHRRVELNFTHREYKAFERVAKAEKLRVSQVVKNMAIAYEQQHYLIPAPLLEKLDTLHQQIRGIANNVNKMALQSHTLGVMVNDNELLGELKKLEDMVTEYTRQGLKR